MTLLDIKALSVTFPSKTGLVQAVRSVDLQIERGSIHGLIGESGCGKTMTGMALLGLAPQGAQIAAKVFRFDGMDLTTHAANLRGRRIALIERADRMNEAAQNALLKTLEEPHDDVTIIMTTSRPERLLQTIVSRCQELIVPPLSDEIVIKTLVARGLCSEDEASLVAPFAEGDIQRAADFVSEDVRTLRNSALALLRSALRGKDYRNALSDAAAEIGDERSKAKAEATLSLLAVWLRDAYALALGGPDVRLVNADDRSALEKFAAAFGSADLLSVITVIERAARDIQRNTSITLTLLTAMMDIRVIIARTRVSA
jgi:DNA polymerase III gamma/tau subunit